MYGNSPCQTNIRHDLASKNVPFVDILAYELSGFDHLVNLEIIVGLISEEDFYDRNFPSRFRNTQILCFVIFAGQKCFQLEQKYPLCFPGPLASRKGDIFFTDWEKMKKSPNFHHFSFQKNRVQGKTEYYQCKYRMGPRFDLSVLGKSDIILLKLG